MFLSILQQLTKMFPLRKSKDLHFYDFQGEWKCQGPPETIILQSEATELLESKQTQNKKSVVRSWNIGQLGKGVCRKSSSCSHKILKILNDES